MRPGKKLLCTVQGIKLELDGKVVLLIKNPIPEPYYKSKDGMGMRSFMDELGKRILVVPISQKPTGELIFAWPETVPEEIRKRTIEPSDLNQVNIYEDGEVEVTFGNS